MSGWIDWAAVGKIVGFGLLAGAGLPALFAIGLRLVTPGTRVPAQAGPTPVGDIETSGARVSPLALAAGWLCFALVVGALGYGIFLIINK